MKFEYQGKVFNARLAVEDAQPDVIALLNQPGADGFSLDSTPLFEVGLGYDSIRPSCWFGVAEEEFWNYVNIILSTLGRNL